MKLIKSYSLFESNFELGVDLSDDIERCKEILAYLSDDGFIVRVISIRVNEITIDIRKGNKVNENGERLGFNLREINQHINELRSQLDIESRFDYKVYIFNINDQMISGKNYEFVYKQDIEVGTLIIKLYPK
jgi:exonuclease I